MNFTNLSGVVPEAELTSNNLLLRRAFYTEFSNTTTLRNLYADILRKFKEYLSKNLLLITENPEQDILYSFFTTTEFKTTMEENKRLPISIDLLELPYFRTPELLLSTRSRQVVSRNKVINMLPATTDTSDNSNSSDSEADDGPSRKKFKACPKTTTVDCGDMLTYNRKNSTYLVGTAVHVDILIFIDKSVCKQLSKYLGLVYMEDLLKEAKAKDINSVFLRLQNKNAKICRLIQSYLNKRLIEGWNNVCLVHTLELFENINANVKAVISNDYLHFRVAIARANFHVKLNQNSTILDYIESVALIIDNALKCKTHLIARYKLGEDSKEKENNLYYIVKLPLISIIPLYILRHFAQSAKEVKPSTES